MLSTVTQEEQGWDTTLLLAWAALTVLTVMMMVMMITAASISRYYS